MLRSIEEKELKKLEKKETKFNSKKQKQKESSLNNLLSTKVPESLQSKLESAFFQAFKLAFYKGTPVIEKTYNKEKLQQEYDINSYIAERRNTKKSLQSFGKKSGTKGNEFLSAASGITLGALGIGLPDIPLFITYVLKSIYQISLSYGYDYHLQTEKEFLLYVIKAALLKGPEFEKANDDVDFFIENGFFRKTLTPEENIQSVSCVFSKELLYTKFLQGVPVIGVVGGSYDYIYIKRLTSYAKVKYYKRFLHDRNQKRRGN